jgi:hypothetical protein
MGGRGRGVKKKCVQKCSSFELIYVWLKKKKKRKKKNLIHSHLNDEYFEILLGNRHGSVRKPALFTVRKAVIRAGHDDLY